MRGPVITERSRHQAIANDLGIQVSDHDKAVVLAQLAIVLARDPQIGPEVAFKGGAILRMAHESPRVSKDLDASALAKKPIRKKWLNDVLSEYGRNRGGFVQSGYQLIEQARRLHTKGLSCNAPSGRTITVSIEFNWLEPLLMAELERMPVEDASLGRELIPVMHRVERAAEKVRAFLDRALGADAFDLFFYEHNVLSTAQFGQVHPLLPEKFKYSGALKAGTDLKALFDLRVAESERSYRSGAAVISGSPPPWEDIAASLGRWRSLLP